MAIPDGVSRTYESQTLNPTEVSSLNLFDSLLASEREAIELRRYLWAWNPKKVQEVLANIGTNAEDIPTMAVDIAYLHSAYLRATDEVVANEVDPDFFAAGHEFGLRMMTGEYSTFIFDAYDKVLEFMREQTKYGTNNIPPAYSRDIVTSAGTIRVGERGIDTTNAVTLKDVMEKMGLIMEASTQGLRSNGPQGESKIESGGLPPSVTLAMIITTIVLITTLIANNSEGISKWLAGKESSSPLSGQPASPDDIPQGDGAAGGDGGGPDPLDPSLRLTPTFPVPQITLTPSSTPEVVTIDTLALIPADEREQMMFEATGVDFITSDEAPHLGFEVVEGEDGSYSIDRVYNILTGELIEVTQRADNVGADTFTYVDQDWQSLDQEALGHVQVFPRVDGKGVVVLKMPSQYSVFSDDPSTPDVREFLTKKVPEWITALEMQTFSSFDDAMNYSIFVLGSRHDHFQAAQLSQDPAVRNATLPYFYGGSVVIAADISTPDNAITFIAGVRLLPNGDLVVAVPDINGVFNEIVIKMTNGVDANGRSVSDIVNIVKVAGENSGMVSKSTDPNAQNTLPTIPSDFLK